MIGYLKGKIISSKPTKVTLDVNGVGYLVNISINTFEKINDKDSAELYIYTNVKEDSISLFGFYSEAEKEMFELLISVNGVGPKLAQSILSGIQVNELREAIQGGNITRIIAVPGIGRKTAERLVLELKTKVDSIIEQGTVSLNYSVKSEAVAALTTLGYNIKTAEKSIMDVLSEEPNSPLEELIKKALNKLNK
jgi:holliday junction DNA helicase RuvA